MKKILLHVFIFFAKWILRRKPKFLLIFGHMRSGSTMLSHILMSHPEVQGLGESNRVYNASSDFWKLVLKCTTKRPLSLFKQNFFLDQINHNYLLQNTELIKSSQFFIIILVRVPHHSTASLMRLSEEFYDSAWNCEKAERYYIERLNYLKQLQNDWMNSANLVQVDYDSFLSNPDSHLQKLSAMLRLQTPLNRDYKIFSFTGKKGDPSPDIQTGTIIRSSEKHKNTDRDLVSKEAWSAYENFYLESQK